MLYFSVISSSVVPTMMWAPSMRHEIIENAWLSQLLQKWVLLDHGMLKWAYPLPCFFSGWVSKQQQREDYRLDLVTITVGQRSWAAP
jgi:hypothetical protein